VRVPLFAANWKMNKAIADLAPFVRDLKTCLEKMPQKAGKSFEVVLAPSATHLQTACLLCSSGPIEIGAQNCGHAESGAFTGEVSPLVLKELGCAWVILGHSERRHLYLENNERVLGRLQAALKAKLKPILCMGETLPERKANQTIQVVQSQLDILKSLENLKAEEGFVIAYEPVWAIGTGENATPDQAQEVHGFIRGWLREQFSASFSEKTRILYGGSVKPDNSQALMSQSDVDGFLVGGASLEAKSFGSIIENSMKTRG